MQNFGKSAKDKCPGDMAVRMRTPWVSVRVPLVLAGFINGDGRNFEDTLAHEDGKGDEALTTPACFPRSL